MVAQPVCTSKVGSYYLGCGTVYKYNRNTGLKILVQFTGPNGAYGSTTPLLVGATLYGVADAGGSTDNGVIFSIKTDGTGFKLLHQFSGTDGEQPCGPLVLGAGSILYGVTCYGGPNYPHATYGVLFDLKPNGTFNVLHTFTNGPDGAEPDAILVTSTGIIVGSTFGGASKGPLCGYTGCGVVFAYSPTTKQFAVIHRFTGNDGSEPALGSLGPRRHRLRQRRILLLHHSSREVLHHSRHWTRPRFGRQRRAGSGTDRHADRCNLRRAAIPMQDRCIRT